MARQKFNLFVRYRVTSLIVIIFLLLIWTLPSMAAEDPDAMKAAAEGIYDALAAHDLDKFISYYTDDVVFDIVANPPVMNGKTELRAFYADFLDTFPDLTIAMDRMFISDNILVCEYKPSGTLSKPWLGIQPTGKSATIMALDVMEFENGKVKRTNNYWDAQGILVQLGLMPVPEMPELKPSFELPDPEPTGLAPVDAVVEAQTRWNAKDLEGYARMQHVDDVAFFAPIGVPLDRAGGAALHELYFEAISDLQVERIRTIDIGDGWALCECVWKGTHDGPYFGIPATGKSIELRGGILYRFDEDGLETDIRVYFDNITVLTQMGVFPPLPPMPEFPPIPDYLVQDQITSPSLEGNLLGDPATRDVLVYLPSGYEKSPEKRYPVIYLLHGFTMDHKEYVTAMDAAIKSVAGIDLGVEIGSIVGELMASGAFGNAIIVMPDSRNSYGGSWYEKSEVIGDYRNYIAHDLVAYIDGKYRTIADRDHRAIAGHSMGGYGALSLAIEYSDVFGAVASLSPGAPNDVEVKPTMIDKFMLENPDALRAPVVGSTDEDMWKLFLTSFNTNALYSLAAAYSPNPGNPPYYVDLPIKYPEKTIIPEVWEKWKDRDLASQIEQGGDKLANTPVFIDKGIGQTMIMEEVSGVKNALAALDAKGIKYTYDEFDGDHVTRMRYQLASALKFLYPHIAQQSDPVVAWQNIVNAMNAHDVDQFISYIADDIVFDSVPMPPPLNGKEAVAGLVKSIFEGFPDFHIKLDSVMSSGNMVVSEYTITGTHQGIWAGIPPTGKSVRVKVLDVMEYEDGKEKSLVEYFDSTTLMTQLGVMPASAPDPALLVPSFALPAAEPTGLSPLDANAEAYSRLNSLDLANYAKMFHPDAQIGFPGFDSPVDTATYIALYENGYIQMSSDFHVGMTDALDMGNGWVLSQAIVTGVNDGPNSLLGFPATGKAFQVRVASLHRFDEDGLITNINAYPDFMALLAQLGLLQPPAPTQEEQNKGLLRDIYYGEIWSKGNLDKADEILAPDYVFNGPSIGEFKGPAAFKQLVTAYRAAFPDMNWTVHDQVAVGDMVTSRVTGAGTNEGEFMGVPATGKKMVATGISTVRIIDGKIQESWTYIDMLGVAQQLGILPTDRENYGWSEPSTVTGDPGTPEANKAVAIRYTEEFWNQKKISGIDETHSLDSVADNPPIPGGPFKLDIYKQIAMQYITAFPDFKVNIDDIYAVDDKVVSRFTDTATHKGELMGIPATGRPVVMRGVIIYRFADGKIVESWWAWDALGLMKQLTAKEPEGYDNAFSISLSPGLNMISLPLKPLTPYTARSYAKELGSTVVIRYNEASGRFEGFTSSAPGDGFAIEGGKGYIVNVPKGGTVTFKGAAWTNEPPVEAAPSAQGDDAWAFMLSGLLLDGESMSVADGNYTMTVKNLDTGVIASEMVDTQYGYFSAAWADLNRKAVVKAGDRLEIAVMDSNGKLVSGPFVHEITSDGIRNALIDIRMKLGDIIPNESKLFQNYPNPFNPETWIPFQLKDAEDVIIKIYSNSGKLIRTLDLGHRDAGVYVSKQKAAYWDGEDESGEKVASGVYFYSIHTSRYTSTGKMIIMK